MNPAHPAPTAQRLRAIWCEILGLDEVDDNASFFDLNGKSVDAIRLVNRIRADFGLAATVRTVIDAPTVARLVEALGTVPPAPARPSLLG